MSEDLHDLNTPAEKPKNPWAFLESPPKEEQERDPDILRVKDVSKPWLAGFILKKGCLTLLIIFGTLVGCNIFLDSMYHRDADKIMGDGSDCMSQLHLIGYSLYYLTHPDRIPEKLRDEIEPVEITPDMTVADLIREALRQEMIGRCLSVENPLCCARTGEPYLVFPAPASVLLQKEDPHKRIPVVMDPPHAHDESKSLTFVCQLFYGHSAKYISTARVLYADGGIGTISSEEAEELVRKYHPEPMNFP
ncbi:MAG: hypothetical protein J6Y92_07485 [Lentisphaeria bacterium]|nr:hypothetical protein [Lentisphaeria bacterium]